MGIGLLACFIHSQSTQHSPVTMSKKGGAAVDQIVKLIVGAGQASPSPPVGPALGSKGVKSMDFCKEFNARTLHFVVGTPQTSWLLKNAVDAPQGKKGLKAASKP